MLCSYPCRKFSAKEVSDILLAVVNKSIILKLHEFSTFLLAGLCEMVVHDMAKNPPP